MGQLDGQVAVITGGARGQGRAHALTLAGEGADIVVCDRCADYGSIGYPMATEDDLAESVALVEKTGRRALGIRADVAVTEQVESAVSQTIDHFGRVDVLVANAGVSGAGGVHEIDDQLWDDVIGANLTGAFHSIRAVAPVMRERGYGRIVATSSMLGRSAVPGMIAYIASKWGLIGLVKAAANDLAGFGITVNAVAPGNIATPMVLNDALFRQVRPDLEQPTQADAEQVLRALHVQPLPLLEPEEVSQAILFLVGPHSTHITGSVIDVSAGASARFTA